MDEQKEDKEKSSRRKFLQNFGLAGTGAIAAGVAIYAGRHYEEAKGKSEKTIRVMTSDNKIVEVNADSIRTVNRSALENNQLQGREGIKDRRFVMVIDLAKCRNARKCIQSCQSAHHLKPEQYHINTLQMQDSENTAPYFMPKPCMHCDNPPCVAVCPVDATFKRPDGPVLIDNERCIGCRFCMAACPYSARSFNWLEPKFYEEDKDKVYNVELNVPQKKGTITKCLFSSDRIREGKLPYCVSACPNGVYYFGDENEDAVTNGTSKETVQLSKLLRDNGGYRLMEELGTKPRVYYLPPKNRLFPVPEDQPKEEV